MELIALLTSKDSELTSKIKSIIKGYIVYPVNTLEEFEKLQINMPINLLLVDTVEHKLPGLEKLLSKLDNEMVVLLTKEKMDKYTLENLPKSVHGFVEIEQMQNNLPLIVERSIERRMFKNMMEALKHSKNTPAVVNKQKSTYNEYEPDIYIQEKFSHKKTLVNFAKMLTAGFDQKELLNHFMDSVMELTRVSKMSVMLLDKDCFYIKSHFGLDPYIAENLKLKKDSALVTWLSKHARIKQKTFNPNDQESMDIKSEMDLLQCIFSFPMINKGKLIGIFNIDSKITEESFYQDELEIIYVLCNYLSATLKDIDLYHQIWYQKEFAKNILSSMNSGVIAINKDEKITTFNHQAAIILNLNPEDILGQDIRTLPSPLGDLLYETMTSDKTYKRYEQQVGQNKIIIGISSYRLLDENNFPIGSGIVFNDLSDTKRLEEEKNRANRLVAINNFMAKIAHEIRTPLTSIFTYTQLLNEKFKEDDLNDFYSKTVIQSIQQLNSIIDKLIIFSSKPDYTFNKEDINLIIDESIDYVSKNLTTTHKLLKQNLDESVFINVDKKLLSKAISYIISSTADNSTPETTITLSAETSKDEERPIAEISIKYEGRELTDKIKDIESMFHSIFDMNIDSLGDGLNIPISHKIIEEHKGGLSVKSENGTTIFKIKLPVERRIKIRA